MKIIGEKKQPLSEIPEAILKKWPDDISVFLIENGKVPPGVNLLKSIAFAEGKTGEEIIEVAMKHSLKHVISTVDPFFANQVDVAAQMIADLEIFLMDPAGTIIGVPEGFKRQNEITFRVRESRKKQIIIEKAREYVGALKGTSTLLDSVSVIVDELFTNALYNAPKSENNQGIDRSLPVTVSHSDSALLFVAHSNQQLVIGCKDPFGSLDPETVLSRIAECFNKGIKESLRMGPGGAGIGTQMIYRLSTEFYMAVLKGEKTVVCCSMPLGKSYRAQENLAHSVHFGII